MKIIRVLSLGLLLLSLPACDSNDPKRTPPVCGDGVVEGDEECDSGMDTDACLAAGFPAGLAFCKPDCTLDTSWCTDGTCENRLDDTGNGTDCDDPACLGRMGCPMEQCGDAQDNDDDGFIDCDDPDCGNHAPGCNAGCNFFERTFLDGCADGYDSDCDGLIDADDPDCDGDPGVLRVFFPVTGRPVAGAWALVSITFLAQDTEIPATILSWQVSAGFIEVTPQDGGTFDTGFRIITWQVAARAPGQSVTVHALVRIDPAIEAGTELCSLAQLNTDPPVITDVAELPGPADGVCIRVVP